MSEANRASTVAFHKKAVFEGDVENAFRIYAGTPYRQHNPLIEDGMEGLRKFVASLLANHPDAHGEIKRVFADGITSSSKASGTAYRTIRAAKPSLTSTGAKTAKWSSTGMSSSRSRKRRRTATRCSEPLAISVRDPESSERANGPSIAISPTQVRKGGCQCFEAMS